jgi:hypothetical protein
MRNTASYAHANVDACGQIISKTPGDSVLDIAEVYEMDTVKKLTKQDLHSFKLETHSTTKATKLGEPLKWYEAAVRSQMITEALKENETLEIGNEVVWTVESLRDAGVIDQLIKSATYLVTKCDSVGRRCQNNQENAGHKLPPGVLRDVPELTDRSHTYSFW